MCSVADLFSLGGAFSVDGINSVSLFVGMRPTPKSRPRFVKTGRVFTDKKTMEAEKLIGIKCKAAKSGEIWRFPIQLSLRFHFLPPKAYRGKVPDWRPKKPDLDNLTKLVKDACNGVLWVDDAQVVRLDASKIYSSRQGVEIYAREITQQTR
tara:strand:+ start:12856 stop:13311 length:456 start_codon:yes stop_codon:yes gene_type:complete